MTHFRHALHIFHSCFIIRIISQAGKQAGRQSNREGQIDSGVLILPENLIAFNNIDQLDPGIFWKIIPAANSCYRPKIIMSHYRKMPILTYKHSNIPFNNVTLNEKKKKVIIRKRNALLSSWHKIIITIEMSYYIKEKSILKKWKTTRRRERERELLLEKFSGFASSQNRLIEQTSIKWRRGNDCILFW